MTHTGVMVAFFLPPDLAGRIAAPGGEPASDLHVTLAYLGENATTRLDKARLLSVLGGFAAYQFEIEGQFNGVAQFVNGEERAFVTLLDAPALSKFRQRLVECLEQNRMGVAYDHGFIPHVTLAYNQAPEYTAVAAEFGKPILFSEITLAWGDERVTFKLQAQPIIEAKEISTTPPQAVRDAAKRGLELREKYGRGGLSTQEAGKQGIGSGVARAVSLSKGQAQSMNTIKRMSAFFSRHEKNKNTPPEKGNGMIAWLMWGGDPGKEWAEGLLAKRKEVSTTPTGVMLTGPGSLFGGTALANTISATILKRKQLRASKRTAPFSQSKEINDSYKEFTASGKSAGIYVFKENGTWRWVTFSSNPYRDRDREIVSLKALEVDVSRADADGKFGPLRWWHVPRLDLGDCDFNMMHGRILVESGTFRTPEIAEAIKEVANDLEVSIGFVHPPSEPDGDGVFHTIRRFERSLCPKGRVSNLFTRFMVG